MSRYQRNILKELMHGLRWFISSIDSDTSRGHPGVPIKTMVVVVWPSVCYRKSYCTRHEKPLTVFSSFLNILALNCMSESLDDSENDAR